MQPRKLPNHTFVRRLVAAVCEEDKTKAIRAELDRRIKARKSLGQSHSDATAWLWANDPNYAKLVKALDVSSKYQSQLAKRPPRDPETIRYYIRFADRPPAAGYKSKYWVGGRTAVQTHSGISAFAAKWDVKRDLWQVDIPSDGGAAVFDDFICRVTGGEDTTTKIWLITGPELDSVGADGEPMLDGAKVTTLKTLQPTDIYAPGVFDPEYDL